MTSSPAFSSPSISVLLPSDAPTRTISCFGFGSSSYFPAGKGYPKAGKLWPGAKLDTPTEIATSGRLLCVLAAGDKVTCYGDGAKLGVADGAPKEFAF